MTGDCCVFKLLQRYVDAEPNIKSSSYVHCVLTYFDFFVISKFVVDQSIGASEEFETIQVYFKIPWEQLI